MGLRQSILSIFLGLQCFGLAGLPAQEARSPFNRRAADVGETSSIPTRLPQVEVELIPPIVTTPAIPNAPVSGASFASLGRPRPQRVVSVSENDELMEDDADNFASPDSDALAPADANLQEEGEDDEAASDEPETLGEAPEDVSQVFMRTSTVLLSPGEGQYEWGMIYGWQDTDFAVVLTSGVLAVEQVRERSWIVPLSMRYGVTPGTEFFAQLPVGAAAFERSNIQEDTRSSRFGIGDFTTGFKHVFREEKGEHPDVIGSMSVTAPTGSHPFKGDDVASLGDGFWGVGAALTVVKSYEPVVLFASGGYSHEFSREFSGTRIQPGEAFDYSFGMGMAINDRLVASAETLGAVRTFIYADDRRIPDSLQEPLSLRLGLTRIDSENRFIEPFLSFGLNRDAQDFQFGILWTGGF